MLKELEGVDSHQQYNAVGALIERNLPLRHLLEIRRLLLYAKEKALLRLVLLA